VKGTKPTPSPSLVRIPCVCASIPANTALSTTCFITNIFSSSLYVLTISVCGSPTPQGQHGQPQAGSPSTPGPGGGIIRWGRGGRDWRRGDPTLVNRLWKSKTPLGKIKHHIIVRVVQCTVHRCLVSRRRGDYILYGGA
jgi:hypothetical protein